MCQQCLDALNKHFPNLPEEEAGDLLISQTAFPMGSAIQIERQIAELANKKNTRWSKYQAGVPESEG